MVNYIICSVERTGSTLLSTLLEHTGELGRPIVEPFNMQVEAEAQRTHAFTSYDAYLEHVTARAATPNGVAGINLMWRHLARLMARLRARHGDTGTDLDLLRRHFPRLQHFILTERRDVIAQAVSWAIAYQTDCWRSTDPGNGARPHYDFALINTLHQNAVADAFGWETWFAANGIRPHRFVYEDWVRDQAAAVAGASELIRGAAAPAADAVLALRRQSTTLNEDWRSRYVDDLAAYLESAPGGQPAPVTGPAT
ncbi:hypothetical protein KM427_23255 [Nocardioides sp. LMS-CY]|uniref:Stf0 family sulfotransferase n=1 Tax=Nocardioides sp. (strain LMS-CY) TaxID=2840457 RepID=UPI001C008706|nr:Stf0 family sulfotransferase [Nocardioides sp. LMS-CY]QWF21804.1 hypothetical protein KM427_23255 [Nocardioides sp. LMS-CY]